VNARDWPLPAEAPRDPEVCRRCAGCFPTTCCVHTPGDEETCFPVSDMERRRIEEHIALDRGAMTLEPNSEAFRNALRRLFPLERRAVDGLFPNGGWHQRLSRDARGRCVFLRAAGCLLPRQARPYYCRLFPFWVAGSRVTVIAAADCLARREGGDPAGMLALLSCAEKLALDLHGRLRLAWGLPPKEGMSFVIPSPARFST
jgi:Fe-S-cluster containining protein